MEPIQKPTPRVNPKEDDVDLGQLFYKTGGIISNFFSWLGRVFDGIGEMILHFLFFLRRNFIWLLAGLILGAGYGFYLVNKNGANFNSSITIRTNFNSSRTVYSTIDFINALIANGQSEELSRIFGITAAEAGNLVNFEGSPVVSEMITAEMYNERFLNQTHNTKVRIDTFWTKTISYKDFKSSLTKFDYPLHQIKVTSNNPSIFPRIQQGLINYISSNEMLQQAKENNDEQNKQEVDMLMTSIRSIDTLRSNYNKRIAAASASGQGNSLTLVEGNAALSSPELELYDKMLELKDELKMVKNKAVLENNIIQVYSPFGTIGKREGFLEQKVVRYALIGLLFTFVITLLISLYKSLIRLEKKYKNVELLRTGK